MQFSKNTTLRFSNAPQYCNAMPDCICTTEMVSQCVCVCVCVCVPILVTTFPEWPSGSVRPHCVCSVLRALVQFCRFDKADATADVQ